MNRRIQDFSDIAADDPEKVWPNLGAGSLGPVMTGPAGLRRVLPSLDIGARQQAVNRRLLFRRLCGGGRCGRSRFRSHDNMALGQVFGAFWVKKVNGRVRAYQDQEARQHGACNFIEVEGIHGCACVTLTRFSLRLDVLKILGSQRKTVGKL